MRIVLLFLTTALFLATVPAASAKEDNAQTPEEAEKISQDLAARLNDEMRALVKTLEDKNKKHFYLIYNNHNIIATVETVRADVEKAVQSCGEENPDLKSDMESRFTQWEKAVNKKLDAAKTHIDDMVKVQDYTKNKNIRSILKLADKLRDSTAAKIKKVPVTTKESCEYLLKKMDETQDTMTALLEKTLITGPLMIEDMPTEDEEKPEDSTEK